MDSKESRLKSIITILIGISCLTGFYFNLQWALPRYKPVTSLSPDYCTTHYFTNRVIVRFKDSGLISKIREYVPGEVNIGFYYDEPYHGYMTYKGLQYLLSPFLLDIDNPGNHQYIIMFLEKKRPDEAAAQFKHKIIRNLGENLFLAVK